MGVFLALLVGGTKANDGLADNQARLIVVALGQLNSGFNLFRLVAIHIGHHVPAVSFKTLGGIVGEPAFHFAIDRDAVVVIKGDQFTQLLGTGQ